MRKYISLLIGCIFSSLIFWSCSKYQFPNTEPNPLSTEPTYVLIKDSPIYLNKVEDHFQESNQEIQVLENEARLRNAFSSMSLSKCMNIRLLHEDFKKGILGDMPLCNAVYPHIEFLVKSYLNFSKSKHLIPTFKIHPEENNSAWQIINNYITYSYKEKENPVPVGFKKVADLKEGTIYQICIHAENRKVVGV